MKTVALLMKGIAGKGKHIDKAGYFDKAEYFCHHFNMGHQRNCHVSIYTVLMWPTVISATSVGQLGSLAGGFTSRILWMLENL